MIAIVCIDSNAKRLSRYTHENQFVLVAAFASRLGREANLPLLLDFRIVKIGAGRDPWEEQLLCGIKLKIAHLLKPALRNPPVFLVPRYTGSCSCL